MDIYSYLIKDHRKVAKLFKQIIDAKTYKEREQLFLQAKLELELHSDPEHNTLYRALKVNKEGQKDAQHGDKEHKEIKEALYKLSRIPVKQERKWLVQFGELKYIVEHHVEDEEKKMFKDAKQIINKNKAKALVLAIEEGKEKLKRSPKIMKKFPAKIRRVVYES